MTMNVICILYCNSAITVFTLCIYRIGEVIDDDVVRPGVRFRIRSRCIGKEVLREPTCLDVVQTFEIEQRMITIGLTVKSLSIPGTLSCISSVLPEMIVIPFVSPFEPVKSIAVMF